MNMRRSTSTRQLRIFAIPLMLCATWLLDGTRLLQSSFSVDYQRLDIPNPQALHRFHGNENITAKPPSLQLERLHSSGPESNVQHNNDKKQNKSWYETSAAVQTLAAALATSLTPEEKQHWYETPEFQPYPPQIKCPSPKKFERRVSNITILPDYTEQQKKELHQQLDNMSSSTIRNAFKPWIEKGGFHPDLILHGKQVAMLVGIFNGKLHFWGKKMNSAKKLLLAEHLESVLEEFHKQGVKIPDVIFPYTIRSIPDDRFTKECARQSAVPPHLQEYYDTFPVAGIAMDPTIHTGVALMPNMYFGSMQVWDRYTRDLLEGGKADMPWNQRKKRVFWRGKVGKNLAANAPRLEALQAAARDSKRGSQRNMDIALTSGRDLLKEYTTNFTRSAPHTPQWMSRTYFLKVTKASGSQRTPHKKFTRYWGQLNLPGSSLGSYSKNLQNLWPTGAAVLIWNQTAVEFYYDSLKTGVTHVWVNETTIEPMTDKLFENNGELARLYGAVGREWFKEHLTSKAIVEYYRQWFHAWAALQRFTPTPDMVEDPCTCAGWADVGIQRSDGDGVLERCPYCAKYPINVRQGCLYMMGDSDKTLCH